ncbi:putative ABC transporter permease [Halothermothrix orenii]|uniref:ABC-transporter type IV n=1 Tax=Halothermothrix orenii (strain H 168 / OCM 544 / DSM 9562) TaxID=373903 RepID=B8D255_HALOH|nr:membrane protein [Halothermothrix orenii]ACL69282.1 hypothetical protein Hore_05240 [Halothermothrix orenii H 168]
MTYIYRFIIYGLSGWCLEIVWTGLGSFLRGDINLRGWTYLWMFPIYGMALLMEPVHNQIRNWPAIIRGGVYTLIIFTIEYSSGWFLENIIGTCPWDYSKSRYSIKGFIRLDYAPAWFIAGLLFEKLHDTLTRIHYA